MENHQFDPLRDIKLANLLSLTFLSVMQKLEVIFIKDVKIISLAEKCSEQVHCEPSRKGG